MVFHIFSPGPVAVGAPPARRRPRVPASSYGFPMVFHTFSLGLVAVSPPPGMPPAAGARVHFPVVFLWFSYTFSPGPVAITPPPARHRQRVPASIFLWFSCGFPHFQPWAGGCAPSAGPPPAAGARFHFPMVFLWFSTLSALLLRPVWLSALTYFIKYNKASNKVYNSYKPMDKAV